MNAPRWMSSALILPLVFVSVPLEGRMARPAEIVGPPLIQLSGRCPARVEKMDGNQIGAAIPIRALRLGAPVRRGLISFSTGGSGTARFAEMERRKKAGLQYTPKTFDVAGSALPEVYSANAVEAANWQVYQQLPLKSVSQDYDPNGLVFALATSKTEGRIASLRLTLKKAPAAQPKLRITAGTSSVPTECPLLQSLDVYAPAMSADRIRSLFATSGCSWYRLADCQRSQWPRGRVLFVQRRGTGYYVHRWVDYDLLATMRFGKVATF